MVEKSHIGGFWPSPYETVRTAASRIADWIAPASEASVTAAAYRIALELPGVAEDDIHLTVTDGVVTVSGEKRSGREEGGESWYFSERQFGAFSRSFRLPPDAEEAGVTASLKDGVLTVVVPKRKAAPADVARRVPIGRG